MICFVVEPVYVPVDFPGRKMSAASFIGCTRPWVLRHICLTFSSSHSVCVVVSPSVCQSISVPLSSEVLAVSLVLALVIILFLYIVIIYLIN